MRVRNRGYQTAFATQVRARVARATTEQWPDAGWTELPAAGGATGNVPAGGQVVLGPFLWHPTRAGRYTLLVDCDAPGDRSNINPATGLPCAQPGGPPSELEDLVPYDNNLAVAPVRVT